eukprot:CAMPEP_0194288122 /NCGR_PEP_ID=MMETSP0169-20130528/36164_1 /TAXON_ID=218684 /ORGANISM="Corethron pennatum, Strain L29A3" /LENGTH=321 /DNA_ID=CAMNT_0039035031 /DNA_START=118 /DNA_END=1080 /DNA_ORIENTATION=+
MSVLAHKWVSSGALSGKKAFSEARVCVLLHGILGSGRNWMGPARRIVAARPDWKVLLVDHRCHGDSPPASASIMSASSDGRAVMEACAADVEATVAAATGDAAPTPSSPSALLPCGGVPIIAGHSFGGKIALAYSHRRYLRRRAAAAGGESATPPGVPLRTWLFDSVPGPRTHVPPAIPALERVAAGHACFENRAAVQSALQEEGLDPATAAWLAQSVRKLEGEGRRLVFSYDVPGVRAMYEAYSRCDMWDACRDLSSEGKLGIVVAGEPEEGMWKGSGDKLDAIDDGRTVCRMPHSGHNIHVDDLDGLLKFVLEDHGDNW